MKRIISILFLTVFLLSCGDGRKTQPVLDEMTPEFEIVGKKEKQTEATDDEPVSVSSILSGKSQPSAKDGDVGDVVSGSESEDPFGGDADYLNGSDSGYDY